MERLAELETYYFPPDIASAPPIALPMFNPQSMAQAIIKLKSNCLKLSYLLYSQFQLFALLEIVILCALHAYPLPQLWIFRIDFWYTDMLIMRCECS